MFHLAAPKADGMLSVCFFFFAQSLHTPQNSDPATSSSSSSPQGCAAISQTFIIVDVLLCNRAERNDCLHVMLGSRRPWFPHVSLKRSSITANQQGPLGCERQKKKEEEREREKKKTAIGLWLMANELGKGWGYIFTLSGFMFMQCVLSQIVIACVLIHSLGSCDFPVDRADLRRPRSPSPASTETAITSNSSLAASPKTRCSKISNASQSP